MPRQARQASGTGIYQETEGQVPVSDRKGTEGQVPVSDRI